MERMPGMATDLGGDLLLVTVLASQRDGVAGIAAGHQTRIGILTLKCQFVKRRDSWAEKILETDLEGRRSLEVVWENEICVVVHHLSVTCEAHYRLRDQAEMRRHAEIEEESQSAGRVTIGMVRGKGGPIGGMSGRGEMKEGVCGNVADPEKRALEKDIWIVRGRGDEGGVWIVPTEHTRCLGYGTHCRVLERGKLFRWIICLGASWFLDCSCGIYPSIWMYATEVRSE